MATAKKDRYLVLRDCAIPGGPGAEDPGTNAAAGEIVEVDPEAAADAVALLIRDGMIVPAPEGS